jgi:methylase of polypeptide subunit release factors
MPPTTLLTSSALNDHADTPLTASAQERHMHAVVELGQALMAAGYDWVCPSPETQALVNGRFINRKAHDLAGLFGWNRPGEPDVLAQVLPDALVQSLVEAGVLQVSLDRETVRSRVRFSSFAGTLVAHSGWPTHDPDAVAFGPDTYRFGAYLERELGAPVAPGWAHLTHTERARTVVDLGCQSGAAGVLAARLLDPLSRSEAPAVRVIFTDSNARALRFASANAQLAGLRDFACLQTETLADAPGAPDLVLASPPSLLWPRQHTSTAGHEPIDPAWGTDVAVRTVESALQRLAPGGRLLMCTGAPVVHGVDQLWHRLKELLARAAMERHAVYRYQMLEADVSGTLLGLPAYAEVERIAAVGLSVLIPHPR